ncbi:hypothetical protein [Cryptosporangium arvum]|uniref:Uncharacterized protein n=1 Tax=Cryptosporangium arvum DSM 44712 TaxID=927661 RepID=A0A010Z6D5_9ACTN|nr:hypothetical protein [Cryptosporangium arvum]EXG82858.1 hypothetical protein CryarDRAFT_4060 [Cryptosporangium arvum DSM 44712]
MRTSHLVIATAAASTVAALAFAPAAQAARVVATGTHSILGGQGYTKVSQSDDSPYVLTGFVTAKKTSGSKCISARVVYRTPSNSVVKTSSTATSCTTGRTVQASIPTVDPGSIDKAVLEVWYAGGTKSTKTFRIG